MHDLAIWEDESKPCDAPHDQHQALELYLKYNTVNDIADMINRPFHTVRDWVYIGRNNVLSFCAIRKQREKAVLIELTANKLPLMKSIMDNGLHTIQNSLEVIKKSGEALTIDEIKKVSDIIGNMDKILKLDAGVATENIAIANVTPISTAKEIVDILSEVDDFGIFQIEDESDEG